MGAVPLLVLEILGSGFLAMVELLRSLEDSNLAGGSRLF